MPIIIDANRTSDFKPPLAFHANILLYEIAKKRVKVVCGGKLTKELAKSSLLGLLAEWNRSGRLITVHTESVMREEQRLSSSEELRSDDPHVLALANLSGARLVYTEDLALMRDFKNTNLLNPKGRVLSKTTPRKMAKILLARFGA